MLAQVRDAGNFVWRTDRKTGRSVYLLLSNDVTRPSDADPLIGVMETSELAEDVVNTHNAAVQMYGRHYRKIMAQGELGER